MPRIKPYSLDHYYVGKGHRGIHVDHKDFEFRLEYNRHHPKRYGRSLTITTQDDCGGIEKPIQKVEILLGGKDINAIKRMIEVAESEMVNV